MADRWGNNDQPRQHIKKQRQYFVNKGPSSQGTSANNWFIWERLRTGGEEEDRGWDGWMSSPIQRTQVCVSSGSWWWTGRPGVLWSMGSRRVRHDWAIVLNWTELRLVIAFLPRSRHLLISWWQTPSAVIWVQGNKVCHCFHCFPIYLPWSDGTGCHDFHFLNVEF